MTFLLRPVCFLLAASQLLACTAQAQTPWPEPHPYWPAQPPVVSRPNFEAPSATHCDRPMAVREVPGRAEGRSEDGVGGMFAAPAAAASAKSARREADVASRSAQGGGDYPEAMNEALHETVHQLSWRG